MSTLRVRLPDFIYKTLKALASNGFQGNKATQVGTHPWFSRLDASKPVPSREGKSYQNLN